MLTTMDGANPSQAPSGMLSREQILDVTSQCLAENGYEATTIRQIAKRLNCAVGSIYRYFKDKHELMSAVAQQTLDPVVDLQEQDASLEDTVRCYVAAATANAQTYRLMFWLAMIEKDKADRPDAHDAGDAVRPGDPEALSSPESVTYNRALPTVVERIIAGWRTSLGSAAAAEACWAMMHGWLTLQMPPEPIVSAVLRQSRTNTAKPQVGPAMPGGNPAGSTQRNTATAQRPTAKPVVEGDPDFALGGYRPAGRLEPPKQDSKPAPRLQTRPHPAESSNDDLPVTIERPTSPASIERSFSRIRESLGDAAAKAESLAKEPAQAASQSRTAADMVVGYQSQADAEDASEAAQSSRQANQRDDEDVTLL